MIAAAKKADIIDYIKSTENGFETFIGERGLKLSGGQRQRLCIARAIISQPKLLILDEATSALDNQSELSIKKAIDNLMHQLTIIVIAHRLSTVQSADKIFVLEKGRITEQGNHKSLLQQNGLYSHLYNLQFD